MSSLVIYYSRRGENYVNGEITDLKQGNSELIASYIQEAVGADVFQVETVKEYPADYMACTEQAKKELLKKDRPVLRKYLENLDGYDHIFIVGPCWWGTFPMAMFTQIERLNWNGKTLSIVMSHEGSGLGNSEKNLKKICKGARFHKSLAVAGSQTQESRLLIQEWAKKQVN